MKKTPRIAIARSAGFCFGVRRAITLAEQTAEKNSDIHTLGPLIHNPQEVARLAKKGIRSVSDPLRVKKGTLILRTHGIPARLREKLAATPLELVDATCPFVERAQNIVRKLADGDARVVIVGEKTHPEVVALVSYGKGKCTVVENPADAAKIAGEKQLSVVSQTTQTPENFHAVITRLRENNSGVKEFNTICRATMDRQSAASRLARRADVMVVVGGKNSGNTRRLTEICARCTRTYHIETAKEVRPAWFRRARYIGLTAGASTPDWIIENVKDTIMNMVSEKEHSCARKRSGARENKAPHSGKRQRGRKWTK